LRASTARQRRRALQDLDVSRLQRAERLFQIRHTPTEMIDGASDTRRGVAFGDEHPDAAVLEAVDSSFELCGVAAEPLLVPGQRDGRVGRAQVDVVEAERFGILHDLDPDAPWIFDESQLEEPGHVAHRRDDLDAGRFELFHLRVEVGEREADVIDGRARARLRRGRLQEDEPRRTERQPIFALGRQLPPEVLAIPLDRRGLVGRREVDVVIGKGGLRDGGSGAAGDEQQRKRRDSRESHASSKSSGHLVIWLSSRLVIVVQWLNWLN